MSEAVLRMQSAVHTLLRMLPDPRLVPDVTGTADCRHQIVFEGVYETTYYRLQEAFNKQRFSVVEGSVGNADWQSHPHHNLVQLQAFEFSPRDVLQGPFLNGI